MDFNEEVELEKLKATHQKELEYEKQKWEGELARYKALASTSSEMFKGLINFATLTLRGLILINGAAAIALLAFLGHVWSTGGTNVAIAAQGLVTPIWLFAMGTGLGLLASGLAYISQTIFAEVELPKLYEKSLKEEEDSSKGFWKALRESPGGIVRFIAICIAVFSFGFFLLGIYFSVKGFDAGINTKKDELLELPPGFEIIEPSDLPPYKQDPVRRR